MHRLAPLALSLAFAGLSLTSLTGCALLGTDDGGAPQVNAKVAALMTWLSAELDRAELWTAELWTGEHPDPKTQAAIDAAQAVLADLAAGQVQDVAGALASLRSLEIPYRDYLAARGHDQRDIDRRVAQVGALLDAVALLNALAQDEA